jgi:hypothetical protein
VPRLIRPPVRRAESTNFLEAFPQPLGVGVREVDLVTDPVQTEQDGGNVLR